jgi:hypothetical protein
VSLLAGDPVITAVAEGSIFCHGFHCLKKLRSETMPITLGCGDLMMIDFSIWYLDGESNAISSASRITPMTI